MNARAATWSGLVVGQNNVNHRGLHAAVLDGDTPIAITGPAACPTAKANARLLADLLNKAAAHNVAPATLN